MDQVFLDEFLRKLTAAVAQLQVIAEKDQDMPSGKSIITQSDIKDREYNDKEIPGLVDVEEKAAEKLADTFYKQFEKASRADTEKYREEQRLNNKQIISTLESIDDKQKDARDFAEQLQQKNDIAAVVDTPQTEFKITEISNDVIQDIVSAFQSKSAESVKDEGSWLGSLASLVGSVGLLIGGELSGIASKIPGMGKLMNFFTDLGQQFSKIFSKGIRIFKAVPILGDAINIYLAYEKFNEGDTVGALIELAGAIPGFGIIADFYSIYRDITITPEEKRQQNNIFGDFITLVGDKFKLAWNNFSQMPFIRGSMQMMEGIQQLIQGNTIEGLRTIGKGALQMSPVGIVFNNLADLYDWLTVDADKNVSVQPTATASVNTFSLIDSVQDKVQERLGWIYSTVTDAINAVKSQELIAFELLKSAFSVSDDTISSITAVIGDITDPISNFVDDILNTPKDVSTATKIVPRSARVANRSTVAEASNVEAVTVTDKVSNAKIAEYKEYTAPNVQTVGISENALKILLDDLKNKQLEKFDEQIRTTRITNDILSRMLEMMKMTTASKAGGESSPGQMHFLLQNTTSNMLANMNATGY